MKTSIPFLFLVLFSITFLSCSEELEDEIDITIERDVVEFDNLKIGDIMVYSHLTGIHAPPYISVATYTGDTLKLTVVDEVDGKFIIQEQITSNSAIFDSATKYIAGYDKTYKLQWEIRTDSIIIMPLDNEMYYNSHLQAYGSRFSSLEETENKVDFEGCSISLSEEKVVANFFIENGQLHGITYPLLQGRLNYAPMAHDGWGKTQVYNKENGFVRVTSTGSWYGKLSGWDRIK